MENRKDFIGLLSTKLNINDIIESVVSPNCGAVSTFIGTTRDNFEQKKVLKLEYEAYESMALNEIQKVCDKIRSKWNVEKIAIYHRLGEVPVMEASIAIAISSAHRQESLQAVQFALETVKSMVPIWKKEVYENDEPQWKENKECLWAKNDEKEECQPEVNSAKSNIKSFKNVYRATQNVPESSSLDYSSDGSFADSERSTSNSVDYSMCQIKRSVNEMFNRIESFCINKKQRASIIKMHENYIFSHNSSNETDDDTCVCSRVNFIWAKHQNYRNRREVRSVYNQWSHQNTKPSTSTKPNNDSSNYSSVLEERLSTTEKILGMNKPVPRNVYERMKKIENRLLFLESISPEYKDLWTSALKETNKSEDTRYTQYDDDFREEQSRKRSYSPANEDMKSYELENRYGKRFR